MKALIAHIKCALLRMRIQAAEFDATVMQAEMLSAPVRLAQLRADITDMECKLADMRVELAKLHDWRRVARGG